MKIVILAGGQGTRLWPVSRQSYPKQFLRIGEEYSLLQKTILRFLRAYSSEDIVIVTRDETLPLVQNQCLEIGLKDEISVIVEKISRSTAAAFTLAIRFLEEEKRLQDDEIVLLSPADAWIEDTSTFLAELQQAEEGARRGFLVLLGVLPDRKETGYGYIQVGVEDKGLYVVEQFLEKPSPETVHDLCFDRRVLWNTGHLLTSPQVFWKEMEMHCPEIASLRNFSVEEIRKNYSNLSSLPLDYALLEKSGNSLVKKINLTWSDIGSWDSVYAKLEKDVQSNAILGQVVAQNTKNCLIFGEERLIVTSGIEDMLIVETRDALFVGKKGESHLVKDLIGILQKMKRKELHSSRTTFRPWGYYTILQEDEKHKVKKIVVHPSCRLSLQMHKYRSEHWVVVRGTAFVEIGDTGFSLGENGSAFIPVFTRHRLSNPTQELLEIIEIQSGEILTEEDIIRFEDDYAREQVLSLC